MMRRRGQGQTEYIIMIGLVALVLLAAVRHFAFAVDEAIEGSVRALRRHEDPKDYFFDENGNPKPNAGVHVGFAEGTNTKIYDVPIEITDGSGAVTGYKWEYHYSQGGGSPVPSSVRITPKKNISGGVPGSGGP